MTYQINKNSLFGTLLRTRNHSQKRQNNVYICIAFTRKTINSRSTLGASFLPHNCMIYEKLSLRVILSPILDHK